MKTRLLFAAFAVLSFTISLLAQNSRIAFPFKFATLESGDALIINVSKEPYLVTGTDRIRLNVRVVVREDGTLKLPFNVRVLNGVTAGGLTISELKQVLEQRYSENNYETKVNIRFLGSNTKTALDRVVEGLGAPFVIAR